MVRTTDSPKILTEGPRITGEEILAAIKCPRHGLQQLVWKGTTSDGEKIKVCAKCIQAWRADRFRENDDVYVEVKDTDDGEEASE